MEASTFEEYFRFFLSTEALDDFATNNEDSRLNFDNDETGIASKNELPIDKYFAPIPAEQGVAISLLVMLFGTVLNSVILKVYWRLTSSNRVYVLAMAFLDLTSMYVGLVIRVILLLLGDGSNWFAVLEIFHFSVTLFNVHIYMCVPLFLALDRFVAVSKPHKIHDSLKKLRKWKVVIVLLLEF